MRIRNQWGRLWAITLFWTLFLIVALTFMACGKDATQTMQDFDPFICGMSIFAQDLAGTCRKGTSGALEVV